MPSTSGPAVASGTGLGMGAPKGGTSARRFSTDRHVRAGQTRRGPRVGTWSGVLHHAARDGTPSPRCGADDWQAASLPRPALALCGGCGNLSNMAGCVWGEAAERQTGMGISTLGKLCVVIVHNSTMCFSLQAATLYNCNHGGSLLWLMQP